MLAEQEGCQVAVQHKPKQQGNSAHRMSAVKRLIPKLVTLPQMRGPFRPVVATEMLPESIWACTRSDSLTHSKLCTDRKLGEKPAADPEDKSQAAGHLQHAQQIASWEAM